MFLAIEICLGPWQVDRLSAGGQTAHRFALGSHHGQYQNGRGALERAIVCAQHVGPSFMVEQYIVGNLYRATTAGPTVAAVGRRDPPTIIGDGVKTVAELVEDCEAAQKELLIALGYKPEEVPGPPKKSHEARGDRRSCAWRKLAVT